MSGHVRLDRDAFDHALLKDGDRFRAWFWMIARACWKPTRFDIAGATITLERGQFVASRAQLAEAWGWSPSAVERFLARLQTEQMIGRETGQGRSVITIRNYEKYQAPQEKTGQVFEQETGQPADSQRTAKEEGNKELPNGSLPKSARARKAPIPDGWMPEPFALGSQSREIEDGWPPGQRSAHFEQFLAHHRAKGNTFSDPQAAWSTWVLNSRKFGNVRQHPQHQRSSVSEIGLELAAGYAGAGNRVAEFVPRLGAGGRND